MNAHTIVGGETTAVQDSFEDYVHASGPRLKRLAFLLTGDHHQAEDLLQSAYAKALPHWKRIKGYDAPDAYMRRVMVSIRTSWWRRSRGREVSVPELPDRATGAGADDGVVDSQVLLDALKALPERQRAAVVLRHWCDLSEAETAETMGCSIGTVKSTTSKGLANLRAALAPHVEVHPADVPVGDRMAGIQRRARTNRRRKAAAAVAALAVLAAGTAGALRLLPDESDPRPAIDPAEPSEPEGLTIDVTVDRLGPNRLGVTYRVHGTATAWSSPQTHEPFDFSGPRNTQVELDGRNVTGSDGGDIECRAGAPAVAFDETWTNTPVRVPGPGTYTITVRAPYCGADGTIVPNEESTTVSVE